MEFDENVARLQGAIYSLGSRGMLNEAGSVQDVVAALQSVFCNLPDHDKAKLTFFMVLNTRLSVSEQLKGDELVGLFTNVTPYIEKEYLITYVYGLNAQSELFGVVENCPGVLGAELVEAVLKRLKEGSFHRDEYGTEHLYRLWESVFVKICKIERGLHLNCQLDRFLHFFQDICDLIEKVVVTSMKVGGLEMFVGCNLYNFLKGVLFCLKAGKGGNLGENPIYKLGIQLDTNEGVAENPVKVCLEMVFEKISNILENVTVELWVTLSECHFDSNTRDSAQMLIGELAGKILEEAKEVDVGGKAVNCLSGLAINRAELMSRAGIDEIVSNVGEGEGGWFEALVRHPECLEKRKSVECLMRHLHLAGAEELSRILSGSYEYLCGRREGEDLEGVRRLFVGALGRTREPGRWVEKVFEEYRPNLVRTGSTGEEVVEAFNKMSKERGAGEGELVRLCVQAPLETVKGICELGVRGGWEGERVAEALGALRGACGASVSEGVSLLESAVLELVEEELSEREAQGLGGLVVLLGRRRLLGGGFWGGLLGRVKEQVEKEAWGKVVVRLEVVEAGLEGGVVEVEGAAFLVYMCQVLEGLRWEVGRFSGAKAEGREVAGRIVALALRGATLEPKGAEFRWAREEMGKAWEGNRAHFCRLWPLGDWRGPGKVSYFQCAILGAAHCPARSGGDLGKILTDVDRPGETRASVVLSLFVLLPVLSFTEWNLIFDGLTIALEEANPGKRGGNVEQDVLDLFGSSLRLLGLSLKLGDDTYPSYKYCLRNFLRLTKRCSSDVNEASLLRSLGRIRQLVGGIEDEEKRGSCEEMCSPLVAELTGLARRGLREKEVPEGRK